ncbi:hypothetical protein ONZ45_g17981 [Pleurotus djamor]|nr:hypothetical protein ONZ45_g17981 [Pleurotus djamor]
MGATPSDSHLPLRRPIFANELLTMIARVSDQSSLGQLAVSSKLLRLITEPLLYRNVSLCLNESGPSSIACFHDTMRARRDLNSTVKSLQIHNPLSLHVTHLVYLPVRPLLEKLPNLQTFSFCDHVNRFDFDWEKGRYPFKIQCFSFDGLIRPGAIEWFVYSQTSLRVLELGVGGTSNYTALRHNSVPALTHIKVPSLNTLKALKGPRQITNLWMGTPPVESTLLLVGRRLSPAARLEQGRGAVQDLLKCVEVISIASWYWDLHLYFRSLQIKPGCLELRQASLAPMVDEEPFMLMLRRDEAVVCGLRAAHIRCLRLVWDGFPQPAQSRMATNPNFNFEYQYAFMPPFVRRLDRITKPCPSSQSSDAELSGLAPGPLAPAEAYETRTSSVSSSDHWDGISDVDDYSVAEEPHVLDANASVATNLWVTSLERCSWDSWDGVSLNGSDGDMFMDDPSWDGISDAEAGFDSPNWNGGRDNDVLSDASYHNQRSKHNLEPAAYDSSMDHGFWNGISDTESLSDDGSHHNRTPTYTSDSPTSDPSMDYNTWNGISDSESLSDVSNPNQLSSSPTPTIAASIALKYTYKSTALDTSMDADPWDGISDTDVCALDDISDDTVALLDLDIESIESSPSQPSHSSSGPLCEFCDQLMPQPPSVTLLNIRKHLEDLCQPQSSPTKLNPNHKSTKAILDTAEYCCLHRFELNVLPQAAINGWPRAIDFSMLESRVLSLVPTLQRIICQSKDNAFFIESPHLPSSELERLFYLYKRRGSGYYGHAGYTIVAGLLRLLFSSTLSAEATKPLTKKQFLDEVVLPETFILLVQQDRTCTRADAITTLSDSCVYGAHLFPYDAHAQLIVHDMIQRHYMLTNH